MGGQSEDEGQSAERDGRSRLRRWAVPGLALIPIAFALLSVALGLYDRVTAPDVGAAMDEIQAEYEARIASGELDVAQLIEAEAARAIQSWEGDPDAHRVIDDLPVPDGFSIIIWGRGDGQQYRVVYSDGPGLDRSCFSVVLEPEAPPVVQRSSCQPVSTWE